MAERGLELLALTRAEAVEGDREVVHADEGHVISWGVLTWSDHLRGNEPGSSRACGQEAAALVRASQSIIAPSPQPNTAPCPAVS